MLMKLLLAVLQCFADDGVQAMVTCTRYLPVMYESAAQREQEVRHNAAMRFALFLLC